MGLIADFRETLEAEQRHADGSIDGYMRDVREFMGYRRAIGKPQLTGQLVNNHLLRLAAMGRKACTLNRKRMAIRCFYAWLIRKKKAKGLDLRSQLTLIDPIREQRRILSIVADEDFEKILEACHEGTAPRDRVMFMILRSGGIRVSEMCSLDLRSVNYTSGRLRVMGKGRRERIVPISGDCLRAIQDYVGHWRTRYAPPGSPALFVNLNGQRIQRRWVSNLLVRLSDEAKVSHTTPHTLRRTMATSLMNAGSPIEEVQKRLGHESIDSTQQYLPLCHERMQQIYRACHPSCQPDFGATPDVSEAGH